MSMIFKTLLLFSFISLAFQINRVLLFGLDGLNPSCLKNTNYFDYFIHNGSYTFKAKSTYEAWSATGWSSLLCSLDSSDSGIVDNEWVPPWINAKANSDEKNRPFKCLFEIIKEQNSKLRTGFYYDWDWLEYFGNKYMGGDYIDDEFSCRQGGFVECDEIIKTLFSDKLAGISKNKEKDFEFFFLYLGAIDFQGHTKGWCGKDYMQAVENVDQYIRKVLADFEMKGLMENTIFLLTADHGASVGEFNHGRQNDANLLIPFFAMGAGIRKNYEIKGNVHLLDVAPTVVSMLKLKKPEKWRGKNVMEIFENSEEDGFLTKCDEDEL